MIVLPEVSGRLRGTPGCNNILLFGVLWSLSSKMAMSAERPSMMQTVLLAMEMAGVKQASMATLSAGRSRLNWPSKAVIS